MCDSRRECRQTGVLIVEMTFVTLEPTPVACIRIVGAYGQIPDSFKRLMGWAGAKGLLGPLTKSLGMYPDDPATTPADELRSDICVTVPAGTEGEGDIQILEFSGDYAMTVHVGSYDTLSQTYAALMQAVEESDRRFRDAPPMEIYLDGPDTPRDEARTEVYVAVE